MINWKYKGEEMTLLSQFPDDVMGFVYEVTFLCGKKYIGKKNLFRIANMQKLKSGRERPGHRFFFKKRCKGHIVEMESVRRESDWKTYHGSFDHADRMIPKTKRIIYLAKNSTELTYLEAKALFAKDAIFDDRYINDNILGKFYSKNFTKDPE